MYELLTQKPEYAVRGVEVEGEYFYERQLTKCSFGGLRKMMTAKLFVKLLKV